MTASSRSGTPDGQSPNAVATEQDVTNARQYQERAGSRLPRTSSLANKRPASTCCRCPRRLPQGRLCIASSQPTREASESTSTRGRHSVRGMPTSPSQAVADLVTRAAMASGCAARSPSSPRQLRHRPSDAQRFATEGATACLARAVPTSWLKCRAIARPGGQTSTAICDVGDFDRLGGVDAAAQRHAGSTCS